MMEAENNLERATMTAQAGITGRRVRVKILTRGSPPVRGERAIPTTFYVQVSQKCVSVSPIGEWSHWGAHRLEAKSGGIA